MRKGNSGMILIIRFAPCSAEKGGVPWGSRLWPGHVWRPKVWASFTMPPFTSIGHSVTGSTEKITEADYVAFFHQFFGFTNNPALAPLAIVQWGLQPAARPHGRRCLSLG